MASGKSREDEVYQQGVNDGQKSEFVDSVFDHTAMEVSLWDPHLFEIYQKGYKYGQAHRPAPPDNREPVPSREFSQHSSESSANQSEGSGCGALIAILIVGSILVIAILWFVFALAIPLLVIDIAAIALVVSLIRKPLGKFLLPLSIAGACLVVADYNQGWFTKALAKNVPFLSGIVPVLLYVNVLAGLIAAYLLIRALMDKKYPPPEHSGEFTKRNLIAMGCVVIVGALTVGFQVSADSQRRQALQLTAAMNPTSGSDNVRNWSSANGLTWTDPVTGLMWAKRDNGSDVNWQQATNFCLNLQLAGQRNWRLPTTNELRGIYDKNALVNGRHVKGNLQLSGGEWSGSRGDSVGKALTFKFFGEGMPTPYQLDFTYNRRALCVRPEQGREGAAQVAAGATVPAEAQNTEAQAAAVGAAELAQENETLRIAEHRQVEREVAGTWSGEAMYLETAYLNIEKNGERFRAVLVIDLSQPWDNGKLDDDFAQFVYNGELVDRDNPIGTSLSLTPAIRTGDTRYDEKYASSLTVTPSRDGSSLTVENIGLVLHRVAEKDRASGTELAEKFKERSAQETEFLPTQSLRLYGNPRVAVWDSLSLSEVKSRRLHLFLSGLVSNRTGVEFHHIIIRGPNGEERRAWTRLDVP